MTSRSWPPCYLVSVLVALVGVDATATDMGMGAPPVITYFSVDRLEGQLRDGNDALVWEAEGWVGRDLNKLWFKTKGEDVEDEGLEQAELQLLFSRAVLPFWDLQLGLRHDLRPNPSKSYGVVAMEGMAPYRIDVEAAAFISEDGDASARLELEYDLRLTQRWILQPRAELDFAFSQVSELDIGRGPTKLETGLRLRYQVLPEFAPYLGLNYETALGDTRGLLSDAGESRSDWGLVVGVTAWF
ncbi:MAG: copper resistance protein B [Chromatiales bacterium]|nr:MAG: copper resistance protein B [Chromatiales bacterium]